MGPNRFATRRPLFTSLARAQKLLGWLVLSTALAACGTGDEDSEPVATVAQAVTATTTPLPVPTVPVCMPVDHGEYQEGGPLPKAPAIWRDVHLMDNPSGEAADATYTYPIIPPFRTSADGRVGVDMASGRLFLFSPEKLTMPVTAPGAPAGPQIVNDRRQFPANVAGEADDFYRKSIYPPGRTIELSHQLICDGTPQFDDGVTTVRNPHKCNPNHPEHPDPVGTLANQDCYSLKMISAVADKMACKTSSDCTFFSPCIDDPDPDAEPNARVCAGQKVRYWSKAFTVVVKHPKTDTAKLEMVSISPELAIPGPSFYGHLTNSPSITADGRLFVAKLGRSLVDPNTGDPREPLDIVYAVSSETDAPCDVTKWTTLHPISHAHWDPNMNNRYGIAFHPLRDPHGDEVPDGKDLQVSYPWIDRTGANLFFTSIQSTLFNQLNPNPITLGPIGARYPNRCLPGVTTCQNPMSLFGPSGVIDFEETENFRGTGVAGLWTHGKMVLLDSAINNIDYGLNRADVDQRELSLYGSDTSNTDYWVRAGTGKYPGGPAPENSTVNTSFVDSLENLFNWDDAMKPLAVRDVVWILNTGKASAELVFDDYLDPNALIVAEMSGALGRDSATNAISLRYYDGFNQQGQGVLNTGVPREVRFQNSATARRWDPPRFGAAHGGVRLEPVALGGIEGKGAWLDGVGDAISFTIPDQSLAQPPKVISEHPWYLSLFIDPRFHDDGVRRKLFTFGSHDGIVLVGRSAIEYENASGQVLHSIDISSLLHPIDACDPLQSLGASDVAPARGAWSHLAFVLDYPQNRTRLYVNGYLKRSTVGVFPLVGTLRVGDDPSDSHAGFAGWIDEVKLLAYHPTPELACNHARGTLMQVSDQSGPWLALAQSYPLSAHQTISAALGAADQKYVCYHKYRDHRRSNPRYVDATLGLSSDAALGLIPKREQLTFPEADDGLDEELEFNSPRPRSRENPFCLTCHHLSGQGGLDLGALDEGGSVLLQNDPRRQPMMPPRIMYGNVPTTVFGTTQSLVDPYIDKYAFPISPP